MEKEECVYLEWSYKKTPMAIIFTADSIKVCSVSQGWLGPLIRAVGHRGWFPQVSCSSSQWCYSRQYVRRSRCIFCGLWAWRKPTLEWGEESWTDPFARSWTSISPQRLARGPAQLVHFRTSGECLLASERPRLVHPTTSFWVLGWWEPQWQFLPGWGEVQCKRHKRFSGASGASPGLQSCPVARCGEIQFFLRKES